MRYLFIGGHSDGRWIELKTPLPFIDIPILKKDFEIRYGTQSVNPEVKTERYQREELFQGPSTSFCVYIIPGLPVIETLISGYHAN